MKISFDLDDTAWKYRTAFAELAHCFKARGHTVGILTGQNSSTHDSNLRIWLARGFPPADFRLCADDAIRLGIPWVNTPQREWKLALAKHEGIDVHFDDFGCRHDFEIECVVLMPDQSKETKP
jgi:hypothetical protein